MKWNQTKDGNAHVSDGAEGFWADFPPGTSAQAVLDDYMATADYGLATGAFTVRAEIDGDVASVDVSRGMVVVADPAAAKLAKIVGDLEIKEMRKETLTLAIKAGVSEAVLIQLRDANRVSRKETIVLPQQHLESLSRGKGWCRKGNGTSAVWGEREDAGYRVGPGRWTVGGSDGFSRKSSASWEVEHVKIGGETWTIAN